MLQPHDPRSPDAPSARRCRRLSAGDGARGAGIPELHRHDGAPGLSVRRGGPLSILLFLLAAVAAGYLRSPTRRRDAVAVRAAKAPEPTASSPRADSAEGALVMSADEALSLRALVVADAFDSVEARLAGYEALAAHDVAAEDLLYDAY